MTAGRGAELVPPARDGTVLRPRSVRERPVDPWSERTTAGGCALIKPMRLWMMVRIFEPCAPFGRTVCPAGQSTRLRRRSEKPADCRYVPMRVGRLVCLAHELGYPAARRHVEPILVCPQPELRVRESGSVATRSWLEVLPLLAGAGRDTRATATNGASASCSAACSSAERSISNESPSRPNCTPTLS